MDQGGGDVGGNQPAGGGGGEAGRMWEGCAGGSVWRSLLPGRQQQGVRAGRWPEQAQHAWDAAMLPLLCLAAAAELFTQKSCSICCRIGACLALVVVVGRGDLAGIV